MLYLSPIWHMLRPEYRSRFGYLVNLQTQGRLRVAVEAGRPWMLDNSVFAGKWTETEWMRTMEKFRPHAGTCLAVVCPDVVGDAATTLARFQQYAPLVRAQGYPAAFVTQDGLRMGDVPWDEFDVLFVGGSDDHKLRRSWPFIVAAQERGKWVHVGRVNSARRIEMFWMADSVDGTDLVFNPKPHHQRHILNAAEACAARKKGERLL